MFYKKETIKKDGAVIVLTPRDSKRLIAKAVNKTSEVLNAKKSGLILVVGGTTNAFVVEELIGRDVDKILYSVGRITDGEFSVIDESKRIRPVIIKDGLEADIKLSSALLELTTDDVYIKGANAVDPDGIAGVLVASDTGGTIGQALGIIQSRGCNLIVPVGLEKLIPSVLEATEKCTQGKFNYSSGYNVGLIPLVGAKVVTEIQAIEILFYDYELTVTHVASGGVAGSEGAVMLAIEGNPEGVKKVFDFLEVLKEN